MQQRIAVFIAGAALLSAAPLVYEQALVWRIVAGGGGSAISPVRPAGVGRTLTDITLGDVGADLVGLRIANRHTFDVRPGSTGTQRLRAFTNVHDDRYGAWPDEQRAFVAQVGSPALPMAATDGAWR